MSRFAENLGKLLLEHQQEVARLQLAISILVFVPGYVEKYALNESDYSIKEKQRECLRLARLYGVEDDLTGSVDDVIKRLSEGLNPGIPGWIAEAKGKP